MKDFRILRNISFALFLLSVISIQSCDKAFDNISPDKLSTDKDKTPENGQIIEWTDDVTDACKTVCLVAGKHMEVGLVDVTIEGEDLLVTYNILEPGIYLEEVHLDIFTSIEQFKSAKKISGGGAIPGKFKYKKSWSSDEKVAVHSVKIPKSYIAKITGNDEGDDIQTYECFYIATHAALSNDETAWGGLCKESDKGVSLDVAKQFPGANWSVFFEFCPEECVTVIDFTYAWEDLQDKKNDADYNDLVIQSDVLKSSDELKISFLASARGALYDHSFKIKIPMTGIADIFGEPDQDKFTITDDGSYYFITIFPSTKAVLPAENEAEKIYANTDPRDKTCAPTAVAKITFTINENFEYDKTKPYDPYITVWPSKTAGKGDNYDLNIWELHKNDGGSTWTDADDHEYPNGILISDDWKWPLERTHITKPYPAFNKIDAWNELWAEYLKDASLVWTCSE